MDDIRAAATAALTTVHQPHAEKGHEAVKLLLGDEPPDEGVLLPTTLVVRSSTAAPSGARGRDSRR